MKPDVEAIIASWHKQIEEVRELLDRPGHVEITLYANRGRVRRNPTIIYHGGPVEFVDPSEVSEP